MGFPEIVKEVRKGGVYSLGALFLLARKFGTLVKLGQKRPGVPGAGRCRRGPRRSTPLE